MFRRHVVPTALLATALSAVVAMASGISVTHTVDPDAPSTALPKQTFRVTGLVTGAAYRLSWRLIGLRRDGCTHIGSSIVIKAYRRRVDFLELPDGSYTGGSYSGFCAGRTYRARIIRVTRGRAVTVKSFTITGAPIGPGPRPGNTPPAQGDDARATVSFTDDPDAPAGLVPDKIAHLSGLTPGATYIVHIVNRTPADGCFNEGDVAGRIAGNSGSYDAPVPSPYYGQGYDLCPGATYDAELRRSQSETRMVTLQVTSFTAGAPRS